MSDSVIERNGNGQEIKKKDVAVEYHLSRWPSAAAESYPCMLFCF